MGAHRWLICLAAQTERTRSVNFMGDFNQMSITRVGSHAVCFKGFDGQLACEADSTNMTMAHSANEAQ